jgi:hypothetical protein
VVKALIIITAVVFFRFPVLLSPGLPLALKVKVNAGALALGVIYVDNIKQMRCNDYGIVPFALREPEKVRGVFFR